MAKLNLSTTLPSSIRFFRNLSAISRVPTPSSAILAVLAGLVTSANPFPVGCHDSSDPPPSFLCPSLEPQAEFGVQGFAPPPQTPPPTSPVPGPSRIIRTGTPTPVRRVKRDLAPGYTQGEDGRWRKLSSWSLYGSTICVCHDDSTPTGDTPVDDLATTPVSDTSETDLLPSGWSRTAEKNVFRTTLILSLSLVLAGLIVVFILAFLRWRRRQKDEFKKDLEKKLVKKRRSQSIDSEKDIRTKSKLWTRATTRWRENIRHSARRRRNARQSNVSLHPPDSSTVSLPHTTATTSSSPRSRPSLLLPSRASSPTPTVSTAHSIRSTLTRTDHEPQNINIEPPSPPPPSSPPLPPAYQRRSLLSLDTSSVKDLAQLSPGSSIYDHSAHDYFPPSDSPPPSPLENDMAASSFRVAHVATDDKAVLRQMEVLGSQPPTEPGSSCDDHGSAPVLYEDDVQSLGNGSASELAPSSVGFPLPPTVVSSSKGKAAALEYYDYDDLNVEPDLRPSAPPFEAEDPIVPSAPLQGEAQFLPSAPPEIVDPDDDPTAPTDSLPQQMGGQSVDAVRPGPSRSEPLPRYQP